MSYVVLARKWRPQQFDDVVGQGHVARTLTNAIEQKRIAHSFLFTGARGVGKTSMARILSKALNCMSGPTKTPCDSCAACTEIISGSAVDVYEIDGASNRGINEIRELRDNVRYAPSRDRTKIYIIDEVHMLTTEAFNALLKTLEEPPEHVKFIFATTEPQKIPVTILSRCQRYDFKRISQADIVTHLQTLCEREGVETSADALRMIARQATGGMRDALSLLDQIISFAGHKIDDEQIVDILGVANRTHVFDVGSAVLGRRPQAVLNLLQEIEQYGYDLHELASELVQHFRDMMVVHMVENPADVSDLSAAEIDRLRTNLKGLGCSGRALSGLLQRTFHLMVEGAQRMTRSSHPRLHLEMTLLHLVQLEPIPSIDDLVGRLEAIESGAEPNTTSTRAAPTPKAQEPVTAEAEAARTTRPPNTNRRPAGDNRTETIPTASVQPAPVTSPGPARKEIAPRIERKIDASAATPPTPKDEVPESPHQKGDAPPTPEDEVPESPHQKGDAPPTPEDEVPESPRQKGDAPPTPKDEVPESPRQKGDAPPTPKDEVPESPHRTGERQRRDESDGVEGSSDSSTKEMTFTHVVDRLRAHHPGFAATLEHAHVLHFGPETIHLRFEARNVAVIDLAQLKMTLTETVYAIANAKPKVVLETEKKRAVEDPPTLAEERDSRRTERLEDVRQQILENPAIQKAKEIFEVEADDLRVQVNLFDE
jgi:DNA polymerase III subunit gamma/tau